MGGGKKSRRNHRTHEQSRPVCGPAGDLLRRLGWKSATVFTRFVQRLCGRAP